MILQSTQMVVSFDGTFGACASWIQVGPAEGQDTDLAEQYEGEAVFWWDLTDWDTEAPTTPGLRCSRAVRDFATETCEAC